MRLWFCALGLALASLAPASGEIDAIVARFQSPDRRVRQAAVNEFWGHIEQTSHSLFERPHSSSESRRILNERLAYLDYMRCGERLSEAVEAVASDVYGTRAYLCLLYEGTAFDEAREPSDEDPWGTCGTGDTLTPTRTFVIRRRPEVALAMLGDSRLRFRSALLSELAAIKDRRARPWAIQYAQSSNRALRAAGIEALASFPDEETRKLVLRGVDDPFAQIRVASASALTAWTDENANRILVHLLNDPRKPVAERAHDVLTNREKASPVAAAAYRRLLRESPERRDMAVRGLLAHPVRETLPDVLALFEGQDTFTPAYVLAAIARIDAPAARSAVLGYVDDPRVEYRAGAVGALAYLKGNVVEPLLLQALRDPREEVVWAACKAIGERKTEGAVPILRELLQTWKGNKGPLEYALRSCLGLREDKPIPGV
jgi:HEAT repeat protein